MAKMIKPMIFLKPNQCPHCMGELQVVEEETYVGAIDSTGIPIGGQSFVDLRLRCTKCRKEYPASKKGMHYYITPTTQAEVKIMDDFNPFYQ